MRNGKTKQLTTDQTDELILKHAMQDDGAIEDCEIEEHEVRYFFETDAIGIVCRLTGEVTINR